jgi:anti-anti-sigma factor
MTQLLEKPVSLFSWYRKSRIDGAVVLSLAPEELPEDHEVQFLARSLGRTGGIPRAVVDLSHFDIISSSWMARLLLLRKRIEAAKGRLVLCGLSPLVRETFSYTRLDTLFEILDTVADAVRTLNSEAANRRGDPTAIGTWKAERNRRPPDGHGAPRPTERDSVSRPTRSSEVTGWGGPTDRSLPRSPMDVPFTPMSQYSTGASGFDLGIGKWRQLWGHGDC